MGRPAEVGKETWRGHVRDTRDLVIEGREHVSKLRAFLKVLRKVSEGEEAAKFLDELAATIDDVGATFNNIDDRQIYLQSIGERASNNVDE